MKHSLDNRSRRRPLVFETLESRLLLSADVTPFAPLAYDAPPPVPAEYRAVEAVAELPQIVMASPAHTSREVVFVDASLPDYQRLIADVLRATGGERTVEVILLDPSRDGVAQVGEALATRTGLAAVHIVAHGGDGRLQLGNATLDAAALDANANALSVWSRAFAGDGDLLLYGCNVAATAQGETFLTALARLTGADVAASSDLSGARVLGGDWDLERATGAIEAPIAFSSAIDTAWTHTLATETFDWDSGVTIGQPGGAGTPYTTGPVTLGTGAVTVSIQGYTHDGVTGAIDNGVFALLSGGTPAITQDNTGGLSPAENALQVTSTGFEPDDPLDPGDGWQGFLITIDFSHAGGVSNLGFSIFDADVSGGGGGFIDELVVSSNQGAPTGTVDDAYNDVVAPGIVRGVGTTNSGGTEPFGNATFTFAQSGITQVTIFYKNAGWPTTQGISLHDITFEPEVTVRDDTGATTENATLNVAAAGVLANDSDNRPFAGVVTPGATLNYNAATDAGGNTLWTDDTGVVGWDWQFQTAFGIATSASPAAAVTARPGITSAYAFGGAVDRAATTSFDSLAGNPSDADATFEIWLKPADIADNDVLFETGGTGNTGLSLLLDNDNLVFYVESSGTSASATANLTTLFGSAAAVTGEYIQVVGVYDRDASGLTDELRLYVNGVLVDTDASQTILNDWSSNNGASLGGAASNLVDPGGTWGGFEGAISRFRFYESALTTAQVQTNFNAVAEGLAVPAVNGQAVFPGAAGTTVVLASGATVTMRSDGSYSYNPNGAFNYLLNGQTATDTFTYTATDHAVPFAHAGTATVTITINGISANAAPAIGGMGTLNYAENDAATVIAPGATVSDADSPDFGGGSLTISFAANGTAADQLVIRDEGVSAGQIGVSGADVTYAGVVIGTFAGGASGTDLVVSFNANATLAAVQALARNVTFANTSENPSTAARTVRFTVADGDGGSAFADATVNIAAVNDAPTATDDAYPVAEDGTLNVAAAGVLANDSDVDGPALTAVLDGGPSSAAAFTLNADGSFSYTPTANFYGSDSFTYHVSDGALQSAIVTVTITVSTVNDAPVASGSATLGAVLEDSASPAGATVAALLGANYSDAADGAGATALAGIAIVGNAATAAQGVWQYSDGVTWTTIGTALSDASAVTVPAAYLLRFLPAADFNGAPGALTVRLSDGSAGAITGGAGVNLAGTIGGAGNWSAATVALGTAITAVNDAPVLAGANALPGLAEDPAANAGAAVATLLAGQATDVDAGALSGIAVTAVDNANGSWEYSTDGGGSWSAFGAPDAANARLLRDTDRVRFVPNADWNGAATIGFRAWDQTSGAFGGPADTTPNGGTTAFSTAVGAASVAASPVGDAVNDAAGGNEDVAIAVNVLANDSFENAGRTLTAVTGALKGAVIFDAAGNVTYTPNADWHGAETLTYTVTSSGVTETGTLTVTVNAVADVADDAASTPEDSPITVNILANDSFENAGRTLTAVTPAANGMVAFDGAGNVTYTPNADWHGTETLTYTVTSNGVTETGALTITVSAVSDVVIDAAATNEDTAVTVDVLANDSFEGATPTVSAVGAAGNGTVSIVANQAVYTPSADFNGTDSFTYTVTSGGVAETATVNVTVNAVNDAPTVAAAPLAIAVVEDVASALTGIAFADLDAGAGAATATFAVAQGTLTAIAGGGVAVGGTAAALTLTGTLVDINAFIAGGALTYTTALDATAPVTLSASLNDLGNTGLGGPLASAPANVTLNVTGVNDAPVNAVPAAQALAEDATLAFSTANGNRVTIADVDAGAALVDVTLTVTNGTLALGSTVGLAFQAGADGSATMTVRGTIADINAAMDGMTYAPVADYNGPATLTIATDDRGATGLGGALTDTDVVAITVTPVNDTPTIAAPPALGVTEDVASPVTGIVIGDIDGTLGPVSVTLAVGSGTLAAASGAGVVVAGSGSGSVALVGTTAAINAFIAGGNVTFTTAQDATAPVPLTAFVNDLGNFGAGGPLLSPTIGVMLNVTAVNDAPVLGPVTLSIDSLQAVTIAGANMSATDVDNAAASLVFLVAGAANGHFELAGAPGVAVTSFSQAQVAAGEVRFVHTDALFGPSFSLFVTDGAAIAGPGVAVVSFRAPGADLPPAAQPTARPLDAVPAEAGVVATSGAGLGDPAATTFLRTPAAIGGTPAATFAEAVEAVQVALPRPVRGAALLDPRIVAASATGVFEFAADVLPTALPKLDFGISAIRHDETARPLDVALDSARITGMVMSVGAVWWAARAGGLLASMLASAPAWRHVDPLPVLGSDENEPEIDWQTGEAPSPEDETKESEVFDETLAAANDAR